MFFFTVILTVSSIYANGCNFAIQVPSGKMKPDPKSGSLTDTVKLTFVRQLMYDLRSNISDHNAKASRLLADSLERIINRNPAIDRNVLDSSLYLIGLSYSLFDHETKSFQYFYRALSDIGTDTTRLFGKINYNLGRAYLLIDDPVNSAEYFSRSIICTKKFEGENSPELISDYISLAISSFVLRDFEKSIEFSNKALKIANSHPDDSASRSYLSVIYQNKGAALANISDHSQALPNLQISWQKYNEKPHLLDENYINLIGNLGMTYYNLGETLKCFEVVEKELPEIINSPKYAAFQFLENYSLILAESGMKKKGERIFAASVEKIKKNFPGNQYKYYEALSSYAGYLVDWKLDPEKAQKLYLKCYDYVKAHPWSLNLNASISLGYALAILENNNPNAALDSVCSLLNNGKFRKNASERFLNPNISELKPDIKILNVLLAKYRILDKITSGSRDTMLLRIKASTAELLIDLLETIRLNIGEEQSRLILGSKYRNAYINAIESFRSYFDITGEKEYLVKAFGFSERSKAASLLASMREVKAMKAAIPEEMMIEERELQKKISIYAEKYEEEKSVTTPDTSKLNLWERSLLNATDRRRLLIKDFEKKYPEYSSIKTNRLVIKSEDILKLTGRNRDFLSYVVSDSMVYIFLVNRNGTRLVTIRTDSTFKKQITSFRKLLSEPDLDSNAKGEFRAFQEYGYDLYSILIKPVSDYLVSDNLIISPDNLLSFFPFETLITEKNKRNDLYYSKLPYLMNDFQISYVYSATLLNESGIARRSFRNSTVSFAPSYHSPIWVDSILVNRQQSGGILPDLKSARDEATYVARLTSGHLFLDSAATKSNYLKEAGRYDIVHLAMHTVLNIKDPVNSGMIFYAEDSDNGKYLQPYEIYSGTLDAKMVVLSSCFTGTGTLYAGEGVLSLARGFIYSGSHSVVMSLWEVNDYSGTNIIKKFYNGLKSGKSKSEALRAARINFLREADMKTSHPYFWSTLVIYGDDSAIYLPTSLKFVLILIPAFLITMVIIYFRKR